ncbi:MAG: monofunctional biosynthetic peptidoglycan transglycosylase [Deltaproteobacteria bacterium CG11_big_fil_rev_8_21_14_0_20_47_16]|nr:MAG: monofunctional biosynthetic peptidoglycan transglycosylase [Deltaproteobacteria bacterium CG11_big_fil_rev_8_21_14_0_20_47_16]
MKMSNRKIGFLVILGVIWVALLYDTFNIPNVSELRTVNPITTAFMDRQLLTSTAPFSYEWVPLNKISPTLQRAVIAAEDDEFYEHEGFNWEAIKRAAIYDWKKKKLARGASTITQQLARNLYLSKSKNPFRKLKEFLIALKLERELSKQRILELYLNVVEWGPGVYGAEAASQYYFKHSAAKLSASESAFLASILPNPKRLGRRGYRMSRRAGSILRRM